MPEIMSAIKDVIVSLAAVTTTILAIIGLNKWRSELKGKVEFEIAINLLKSLYKLRDAIEYCRNPFIWLSEFPDDYREGVNNQTANKQAEAYAHVYRNRFGPIISASQDFDLCALEAEAIWGKEIREKTDNMVKCSNRLKMAIDWFIRDKYRGAHNVNENNSVREKMESRINSITGDENNELSNEISAIIASIEEHIKPYLRH